MKSRKGMSGNQSSRMRSEDWITPKYIIDALGPFDLDPCACLIQPWACARDQYTIDDNGLMLPWKGMVWLNPPYGKYTDRWLNKIALHNKGIALIYARTETKMFFNHIWERASALLFIEGRLHFHYPNGGRAEDNSGGPSVLVGYGKEAAERLQNCYEIPGAFIQGKGVLA